VGSGYYGILRAYLQIQGLLALLDELPNAVIRIDLKPQYVNADARSAEDLIRSRQLG